jgi:hypothetical protein
MDVELYCVVLKQNALELHRLTPPQVTANVGISSQDSVDLAAKG